MYDQQASDRKFGHTDQNTIVVTVPHNGRKPYKIQ